MIRKNVLEIMLVMKLGTRQSLGGITQTQCETWHLGHSYLTQTWPKNDPNTTFATQLPSSQNNARSSNLVGPYCLAQTQSLVTFKSKQTNWPSFNIGKPKPDFCYLVTSLCKSIPLWQNAWQADRPLPCDIWIALFKSCNAAEILELKRWIWARLL